MHYKEQDKDGSQSHTDKIASLIDCNIQNLPDGKISAPD